MKHILKCFPRRIHRNRRGGAWACFSRLLCTLRSHTHVAIAKMWDEKRVNKIFTVRSWPPAATLASRWKSSAQIKWHTKIVEQKSQYLNRRNIVHSYKSCIIFQITTQLTGSEEFEIRFFHTIIADKGRRNRSCWIFKTNLRAANKKPLRKFS